MNDVAVLEIGIQAMWVATKVAAPILVMALAIGLFVGLMQSVTQIQEVTLTFVPKILAIFVVIALTASFTGAQVYAFTQESYSRIENGFR